MNSEDFTDFLPEPGLQSIGDPITLTRKLELIGYECLPYLAFQLSLFLNTQTEDSKVRSLLLEGPSGCGKSFLAKSLAKVTCAELMVLSCYKDMELRNLIEAPSSFALASAMAGHNATTKPDSLMNLGIISRAFLTSRTKPVILLIDELDKPDIGIDTFFLGPIQDGVIWLESRAPIEANGENLVLIFTKNYNRRLDDALLRRVHPITMTYLDSTLERKILFDRPPAPEELLTAGKYIMLLLEWGVTDFGFVGAAVWNVISKSEHDRAVLEHMLRYHPDFMDSLVPDSKNASIEVIRERFGRVLLANIVEDQNAFAREIAWEKETNQQ
jgi:energy-coupling factor transporter ATP-binding protein EcfA2